MSINRFAAWEFAIGGAFAAGALVLVPELSPRALLAVLLVVALASATAARNWLAIGGTFLAVWVALPLWGPIVPGSAGVPPVSEVIDTAGGEAAG